MAYKPYFAANFDFSTKLEVVFTFFEKLAVLQRPYMPNLKSLFCLVRSTGAFKVIKGYKRKNAKMSKNIYK